MIKKREKLLSAAKRNPSGWRFHKLKTLLEGYGFEAMPPRRGSHWKFSHHLLDGPQIVPCDRSVRPIYVKRAIQAIRTVIERERRDVTDE